MAFIVVTSTFPPRGGSSVQRVAKFCKYAKRMGAEPVVITAHFKSGLRDETLLEDLPEDLEVHRVANSILGSSSLISRLQRRFARVFLPDEHSAWGRSACRAAKSLAANRQFDAVFVSYGTPSALKAGVAIGKMLKIPIVTDIRDFKQKNIINKKKIQGYGLIRQFLINRLEASLFLEISRFSVVSRTYASALSSHYGVEQNMIHTIYNGYDPEDFRDIVAKSESWIEQPILRYVGFITHLPSFQNLVAAISKINKARINEQNSLVRLEVFGENNLALLQDIIRSHSAAEFCSVKGYIPHNEAIEKMSSASALVLLQHGESGVLTGKLFEYIGAARPIILINNGNHELKALINEHSLGCVAEYSRPDEIKVAIENILTSKLDAKAQYNPSFRREFQAVQFLRMIKAAVIGEKITDD